jgi:hypothetical protein
MTIPTIRIYHGATKDYRIDDIVSRLRESGDEDAAYLIDILWQEGDAAIKRDIESTRRSAERMISLSAQLRKKGGR